MGNNAGTQVKSIGADTTLPLTQRDVGKERLLELRMKESCEEKTTLSESPFHQGTLPDEVTSQGGRQESKFPDLVLIPPFSFFLELPIVQI